MMPRLELLRCFATTSRKICSSRRRPVGQFSTTSNWSSSVIQAQETLASTLRWKTSHWDDDPISGEYRRYTYAERFSKQYQQFKDHQQQTKAGTPLDYLPFLTEAKRAELRALNIYTVEALAIVDGPQLKNLGPNGRELKNKAIEFLESSSEMAKITKLEAELETMKARNRSARGRHQGRCCRQPHDPSEYANMTDEQLREHVKSLTGVPPQGNPSRRTLIRMAQEQKANVAA